MEFRITKNFLGFTYSANSHKIVANMLPNTDLYHYKIIIIN